MISSYLGDIDYNLYQDVIEGVSEDDVSFETYHEYLDSVNKNILTWSGKEVGFFTEELLDSDVVEIHFMIRPSYRKYSMACFRYVNNLYMNKTVVTSVFSTHKHVCYILDKLNYLLFKTEENTYKKDNTLYDVFYYIREKNNG